MEKVYKNPPSVAVLLIPIVETKDVEINGVYHTLELTSLFGIIRGIEPKKGMLALPGGWVDEMENNEIAAAREMHEETGFIVTEEDIKLYRSKCTPNNQILVFCETPSYGPEIIHEAKLNPEVEGFKIINAQDKLAFSLHDQMSKRFLNEQNLKNISNLGVDKSAAVEVLKKLGYFSEDFNLEQTKKLKM